MTTTVDHPPPQMSPFLAIVCILADLEDPALRLDTLEEVERVVRQPPEVLRVLFGETR